uniref:Uncharacterized protein n=2 Tax=Biomphalaria glabrata TaxID=6526 RepID=A0A2C9M681_BIOGL
MLVANRIVGNIYSSLRATIFLVRTTVESCKTMSEPENPSSDAVEDVEDEDHGEETGEVGDSQAIANQLMKNPGVLAALQDKLCSIVGSPSGYIQRYFFTLMFGPVISFFDLI